MAANGTPIYHSARVTRASGMVSVQAGCSFDEAVTLMRARAEQTNCTLEEIAAGVLDRSIDFK